MRKNYKESQKKKNAYLINGLKDNKEPKRIFYICSYGGCGSWMLTHYLKNFGETHHIHSSNPPDILENVTGEYFNGKILSQDRLNRCTVIYIYRNPVKAIYSRFTENHVNVLRIRKFEGNVRVNRGGVLKEKKDLFKIKNFFNNYMKSNSKRNYNIICVKYEDFFGYFENEDGEIRPNIELFNKELNIPNDHKLYPKEKVTQRLEPEYKEFEEIYKDLIEKMDEMPFIKTT